MHAGAVIERRESPFPEDANTAAIAAQESVAGSRRARRMLRDDRVLEAGVVVVDAGVEDRDRDPLARVAQRPGRIGVHQRVGREVRNACPRPSGRIPGGTEDADQRRYAAHSGGGRIRTSVG
jgi:hypothetical protein